MNAVGRIFIVLTLVMSILFMSFTVAVYSSSKNWKKQYEETNKAKNAAVAEASALKSRLEKLQTSVDEQLKAKGDTIAALHAQNETFKTENNNARMELEKLQTAITVATGTIKTTHESLIDAKRQLAELREVFRQTQQDWNILLSDFVKKTDEAHTLSMKLNTLEAVSKDLVEQYNNAKSVLNQFGLKPIRELYVGVPPFQVTGRITEVRATGLVEITVGEDSGLMKGHQLDVYRKSEDGRDIYLGVVEIVLTEPNRAAARVLPEYRKGTVQVNDVVTSEFSQERQKYQIKRDAHVATTAN
ncbi:MAG: hypothetical protein FWC43_08095 [Planctomycetaceae bacterium]|nr:hypothetical protein [Planctomycetaceae bacterium]